MHKTYKFHLRFQFPIFIVNNFVAVHQQCSLQLSESTPYFISEHHHPWVARRFRYEKISMGIGEFFYASCIRIPTKIKAQYVKILSDTEYSHTCKSGPRRPARAKSSVVFPELGGPKSSVNLVKAIYLINSVTKY